jgi:hypothetical protein
VKPTYINIDTNNQPTTEAHEAVRVEHPLLARPIIVTAARSPKRMTHEEATKWAESLDINGWSWRLPTVEEAFLICDRTQKDNVLPPENFPDCAGEYIWTSTPTAWNSGAAWYVYLCYGDSGWVNRDDGYRARAVRAGQF